MIYRLVSCRHIVIAVATFALAVILTGVSAAEAPPPAVPAVQSAEITPLQALQPDRFDRDYLKGYFTDAGRMLASPARWDRSDWLAAGLVIGATTGLYFADGDIRNFAQRNQTSAGNGLAAAGNALGNPLYTAPSLGLFYAYGHFNDDPKARRTSLLALESLTISGAFAMSLKLATQRPRPFTGESANAWNGPGLKNSDPSFPSIHTQSAFSIASVLAEEYGDNPYVPPLAYGLASLTGLARVYDNKHWASDVFFGAAIGYYVGKAVVRYHAIQTYTPVKILPSVSQQGFGVIAEYRF